MSRVAELESLGYTLKYDAKGWSVSHDGAIVRKGGFEEPRAFDPSSAANAIALTKQCALWVAERHLREAQCQVCS